MYKLKIQQRIHVTKMIMSGDGVGDHEWGGGLRFGLRVGGQQTYWHGVGIEQVAGLGERVVDVIIEYGGQISVNGDGEG